MEGQPDHAEERATGLQRIHHLRAALRIRLTHMLLITRHPTKRPNRLPPVPSLPFCPEDFERIVPTDHATYCGSVRLEPFPNP